MAIKIGPARPILRGTDFGMTGVALQYGYLFLYRVGDGIMGQLLLWVY